MRIKWNQYVQHFLKRESLYISFLAHWSKKLLPSRIQSRKDVNLKCFISIIFLSHVGVFLFLQNLCHSFRLNGCSHCDLWPSSNLGDLLTCVANSKRGWHPQRLMKEIKMGGLFFISLWGSISPSLSLLRMNEFSYDGFFCPR